jgi:hypothetical protein
VGEFLARGIEDIVVFVGAPGNSKDTCLEVGDGSGLDLEILGGISYPSASDPKLKKFPPKLRSSIPLESAANMPPAGDPSVVVRGGANPPLRTSSLPDATPAARVSTRIPRRRM